MNEKIVFTGLRSDDYIHPKDHAFVRGTEESSSLVSKGLALLSASSVALMRRIVEGRYVEVTEPADPWLNGILKNTCRILDVSYAPRLFVTHERSTSASVGGDGPDSAQILMPDYILREYDEDMLYYVLGNAVAMLKGGHVLLATVCQVMVDTPLTRPFQMALEACLRAADLSSDRGGLLACQSYPAGHGRRGDRRRGRGLHAGSGRRLPQLDDFPGRSVEKAELVHHPARGEDARTEGMV